MRTGALAYMATLRREMTENGVEPRQIFAFDGAAQQERGGHRAGHRRRLISPIERRGYQSTFVVVTRDGGVSGPRAQAARAGQGGGRVRGRRLLEGAARRRGRIRRPASAGRGIARGRGPRSEAREAGQDRRLRHRRATACSARRASGRDQGDQVALRRERGRASSRKGYCWQAVGQYFAAAVPSLAVARSAYPGLREFLQWALAGTRRICVFADGLALPASACGRAAWRTTALPST